MVFNILNFFLFLNNFYLKILSPFFALLIDPWESRPPKDHADTPGGFAPVTPSHLEI